MPGAAGPTKLLRARLTKSNLFDRQLLLLAIGMFAIGTDGFVIAGVLTEIAHDFDVSIAVAGQLITAYALCYAIFTPITAVATANWPRQRVLLTGLLIFVFGNIVAAVGQSFIPVLIGRGLSGLGAAMFAPMASATATMSVSNNKRASALAAMMIALSTATAFGAPIGTVIGALLSWRYTFVAIAIIGGFVALGIAIFIDCAASPQRLSLRARMRPLHNHQMLLVLLTTFLVLAGLYVTYTYMGVIFDRATHGDGVTLALLISILGIAGTVGSLVSGRLTDRIGSRIVINISLVVLILNFTFLPWASGHLGSSVVSLTIWGFCGWGFVIPQQHRLIGLAPEYAAILLSLYAMAVYGGTSVSGIVGAVASAFIQYYQLPLVGAALVACGLAASEYASRTEGLGVA
jgi:predicted MFS family arabinose efflux permease